MWIKDDLALKISAKNNEIESLKKELQTTISDKYVEIESLKDEKEAKEKEINELKQKCGKLEEAIGEAKSAPKLMEAIKDIMIHKGFLSDREFEDLLSKLEIE